MIFSQKLADRYNELKKEVPDCILLMQVGAFMKVMNQDARKVSALTGLKLQMAGDVNSPVVIGGFPKTGGEVVGIEGRLCRWLSAKRFKAFQA